MGKNIYDMLNDCEIDLNELNKDNFDELQIKKIKNKFSSSINKSRKKRNKSIIAATLAGILFLGFMGSDAGATAMEKIKSLGADIALMLGIEKNIDEYKTVVDDMVTSDGISININEVALNGDRLIITSTIKTDEPMILPGAINRCAMVFVNGKNIAKGGSGQGNPIDKYTIENLDEYRLEADDLTGELDIKIVYVEAEIIFDEGSTAEESTGYGYSVEHISTFDEIDKSNPFIFEFKVNGDNLNADSKEIEINKILMLDNGIKIRIDNYRGNLIDSSISFSIIIPGSQLGYVTLRGNDDKGNEIVFYLSNTGDGKGEFRIERMTGIINEDTESLTLAPYLTKFSTSESEGGYKKVGEEFTINLNE